MCFLTGVLIYVRGVAGEGPHVFHARSRVPSTVTGAVTAMMTTAIPLARWIVDRLPPGDTGIPEDWFPAAMLFVLSLYCAGTRRRGASVAALALSACCGAGLYGYVGLADVRLPITMLVTASAGSLTTALVYRSAQDAALSARRTEHRAPSTDC